MSRGTLFIVRCCQKWTPYSGHLRGRRKFQIIRYNAEELPAALWPERNAALRLGILPGYEVCPMSILIDLIVWWFVQVLSLFVELL